MKVVFAGSPEFAVPSLRAVADAGHEVVLVITQPDRPKGRGMRKAPTPVKRAAMDAGIQVLEAEKITARLTSQVRSLTPDIIAVSAFGLFLPRSFRKAAQVACINVHPSLLPKYRGAAPVQWAIINGERGTGVSIMHVASKMDAGAIILQESEPIDPMDTTITLMERLAAKGGRLLVQAIDMLAKGEVQATPQDENAVVWARALKREDGAIDWDRDAHEIRDQVRGMVPWPVAFTVLPDHRVMKVFPHVELVTQALDAQPGEVLMLGKRVCVACGRGGLVLDKVQLPGKRQVDARSMINGGVLRPGMRLGE